MDFLSSFLGRSGFLPHGYCFTWTPGVLWSMVGADAVIAAAYFSIPLAIVSFVRKRPDSSMNWVPWIFSAFIFACGLTHVMDIWTVWQPDYGLQALTKMVTATISILTAVALWPLMPKALKIPSVSQLQSVIGSLEEEMRKRRSAEDQLIEIQQSLAVTLASIGAGFIATDREGRVTRMNAVAQAVTGWPESEAQGQIIWEVFERRNRPPAFAGRNPVDVMVENGITMDTVDHGVAVSRSGRRTTVEVRATLTHLADGTVRGLAMVFRDMTSLMLAEDEARRLAAIVESSSDAIIGTTLGGRITNWNSGAAAVFGYRMEEVIGQPVLMLIPEDRQGKELHLLADLASGKSVPAFDTVCRTKEGGLLDVSVTVSPIRDARGRIVGASRIARDVSDKRRAEAALRDSEARLRFTLESAQIGDWDIDLTTGWMRRSQWHDRCFGYGEPPAQWTFDTFLSHVHPEDRTEAARTFHRAIAELKDWRVECRVVWPDTSVHWIRAQGSVVRDGVTPQRVLGIVTDITEQKSADEARLRAQRLESENRQIQEANRLKSLFLANMSHELRTPLNAIIGFADLLHANAVPPESPKHRVFLGHISTSGHHLLQLINDVLDLSKVESGKFEFTPEPVHLPALVKEVSDTLNTAVLRKRIRVNTVVDPTLTDLVLDVARLKQVLFNYLSNAIKFTPVGGHVTVRARAEGATHFRLEVEDDGIGIAAADLPRLFSEFQQLDAGYNKRHQGTGLGLALTRRLVQAQGGSVGVRSTVGHGSVFHAVLNRVHGTDACLAEAALAQPAAGPPANRWLVIEDDPRDQDRLFHALSEAGFDVDVATTGEQALRHASGRTYDAITLDLMLPDQHGLGVLANIRSHGPSRTAPVVGMTMPADSGTVAGFSIADVLSKPIRTEEIVLAMARFRRREPDRAKVMVIDDDPLALDLMRSTLKGLGIETVGLLDGRLALSEIDQHRPDAIILDLMMPGFDGFAVMDGLHRLPQWQATPVFIWTSMILSDAEYESLARSASAIVSKGGGVVTDLLDELRRWRPPHRVLPPRSRV